MTEKQDKMVIIATHGVDDPERASLPFVCGNAALAMEAEVVVVLQGTAVFLAHRSCYAHVFVAGLEPLKKLVDTFLELGGKIWVCTPCIREREISEEMLLEGTELVTSGAMVNACLEADAVLNY